MPSGPTAPAGPWWRRRSRSLKAEGFGGASARAIANRAGCNQGLVFYHFGSVVNLLLEALDSVSATRLAAYGESVAGVDSLTDLVEVAATIFEEDLDAGHVRCWWR